MTDDLYYLLGPNYRARILAFYEPKKGYEENESKQVYKPEEELANEDDVLEALEFTEDEKN